MPTLSDIISISVIGLYVYPLLRAVSVVSVDAGAIALRQQYIWFAIGMFMVTVVAKLIKLATADMTSALFKRPKGATACDMFLREGNIEGKPGMPSGHVAAAAFFFTYMLMIAKSNQNATQHIGTSSQTVIACVGAIYTCLVAWARTQKRCHTFAQVMSGAVVGVAFAFVWFKMNLFNDRNL